MSSQATCAIWSGGATRMRLWCPSTWRIMAGHQSASAPVLPTKARSAGCATPSLCLSAVALVHVAVATSTSQRRLQSTVVYNLSLKTYLSMSSTGSHMVAATWSIEPAEVNAMFTPPKFSRLQSPLNKLDPTNRLKVADWLIQLRAPAQARPAKAPSHPQLLVLTFGCTSTSPATASGTSSRA